jgi:hypothetical protein
MSALYDADILEWSERQAGLLRRVASGEPVNEPVDWANVIEEVESVGRSQLKACESLLRQALIQFLKLRAWPTSKAASHWRGEALEFMFDARSAFSPSMRQPLDFPSIYRHAVQRVRLVEDEAGRPNELPEMCRLTLDDLLSCDVETLEEHLTTATRGEPASVV